MVYYPKKSFLGGTMMELTEEVKALLCCTAKDLKGSARRRFMARTVQALGEGGQRLAERELGWNRQTIRKGTQEADEASHVVRVSMDAKASVKVGPFARGGKSRVPTKAADHDFESRATVTPLGIFLPASDELFLYAVTSKVTSDCLVDRLVDWWETVK